MLQGYLYETEGVDYRGVVVLAHGFGGGGHNSYMSMANFFAHHGYYAFAFDCTGNDESEGTSARGLPQGIIDLDYAIRFVETIDALKNLPVMLLGHSWGGYSVTNVLRYHPEVRAVVSFSGFNRSLDLIEDQGRQMVGGWISLFLPFMNAYERIKFGTYASGSATEAFASARDTAVMIIHGTEDTVVSRIYGYDIWYDAYGKDEQFYFRMMEGKGHGDVYQSDAYISWKEEFNAAYDEWLNLLPYDYKDKQNRERYAKDRAEYLTNHLDRTIYAADLDEGLFEEIIDFFDESINK